MKKYFLFILFINLSGCCALTSNCGCEIPAAELTAKTLEWISPYEETEFLVFEDIDGLLDTLFVERQQRSDYVGGDECGGDTNTEIVILNSQKSNTPILTIFGAANYFIRINDYAERDSFLVADYNSDEFTLRFNAPHLSGGYNNVYEWEGESLPAIIINCKDTITTDTFNCSDFIMTDFVIAKDLGLLRYVDRQGIEWERNL